MTGKISFSEHSHIAINREGDQYEKFLESIRMRFARLTAGSGVPIFQVTNKLNFASDFLAHIPEDARQHYNCHACRHFIERFGNLVIITNEGTAHSLFWMPAEMPEFFQPAVRAMKNRVESSSIADVFYSSDAIWGTPVTGEWQHMAAYLPQNMVWFSKTQYASQKMAEQRENFKMLISALDEYSPQTVNQALEFFRSGSLYRGEKVLRHAEWLHELYTKCAATKRKTNIVWLAVADAPAGFCHVKTNMLGTLMDDIKSGLSFEQIARQFGAKMNPTLYQRPQAAPTAGNIARAEKLVEQLNIARSLERRFARIDEIKAVWLPRKEKASTAGSGVFGHLVPKKNDPAPAGISAPTKNITWRKFKESVLPHAIKMQVYLGNARMTLGALVTAVHADAEPILQWDSPTARNPFSQYVYSGGSSAAQWNLHIGWNEVTGITLAPAHWQDGFSHMQNSALFIIAGAKDTRYRNSGCAIFPETLKSSLHEVRSTIEAYSAKGMLQGYDEASASGVFVNDKNSLLVNVISDTGESQYLIDRWE